MLYPACCTLHAVPCMRTVVVRDCIVCAWCIPYCCCQGLHRLCVVHTILLSSGIASFVRGACHTVVVRDCIVCAWCVPYCCCQGLHHLCVVRTILLLSGIASFVRGACHTVVVRDCIVCAWCVVVRDCIVCAWCVVCTFTYVVDLTSVMSAVYSVLSAT